MHNAVVKIDGFDWDDGNWPKCGKHGVSQAEIEQVLLGTPAVLPDPHPDEPRMRAIGKTAAGRYVFLALMWRQHEGIPSPLQVRVVREEATEAHRTREVRCTGVQRPRSGPGVTHAGAPAWRGLGGAARSKNARVWSEGSPDFRSF